MSPAFAAASPCERIVLSLPKANFSLELSAFFGSTKTIRARPDGSESRATKAAACARREVLRLQIDERSAEAMAEVNRVNVSFTTSPSGSARAYDGYSLGCSGSTASASAR